MKDMLIKTGLPKIISKFDEDDTSEVDYGENEIQFASGKLPEENVEANSNPEEPLETLKSKTHANGEDSEIPIESNQQNEEN